jgi:hypothetical protein
MRNRILARHADTVVGDGDRARRLVVGDADLLSASDSNNAGLAMASKRSLSQASDALLTSSRRKMSRLLYSEWIIRCSSCFTSAWKFMVWAVAVSDMTTPNQ